MASKPSRIFRMSGPGTTSNSRVVKIAAPCRSFQTLCPADAKIMQERLYKPGRRSFQSHALNQSQRQSLAQTLASTGALVFEGELLER